MLVIEVWLRHICLEIHDFGALQLQLELVRDQGDEFTIGRLALRIPIGNNRTNKEKPTTMRLYKLRARVRIALFAYTLFADTIYIYRKYCGDWPLLP